jgi:hypothetical protein
LLVSVLGDWVVNTVSGYMLIKEKQTVMARMSMVHDCLLHDLHQALPQLSHWAPSNDQSLTFKTQRGLIEWKVENSWLTRTMQQEGGKQKSILLPRVTNFSVALVTHQERVQMVQIKYSTGGAQWEMAVVPGGV